jgi:hypothetical protein
MTAYEFGVDWARKPSFLVMQALWCTIWLYEGGGGGVRGTIERIYLRYVNIHFNHGLLHDALASLGWF